MRGPLFLVVLVRFSIDLVLFFFWLKTLQINHFKRKEGMKSTVVFAIALLLICLFMASPSESLHFSTVLKYSKRAAYLMGHWNAPVASGWVPVPRSLCRRRALVASGLLLPGYIPRIAVERPPLGIRPIGSLGVGRGILGRGGPLLARRARPVPETNLDGSDSRGRDKNFRKNRRAKSKAKRGML